MNRILFEKDEIVDGIATFGGERAEHVMNVLHGEVGQVLKTGEIGGFIGTGVITGITRPPSSVSSPEITTTSAPSDRGLISSWRRRGRA